MFSSGILPRTSVCVFFPEAAEPSVHANGAFIWISRQMHNV